MGFGDSFPGCLLSDPVILTAFFAFLDTWNIGIKLLKHIPANSNVCFFLEVFL